MGKNGGLEWESIEFVDSDADPDGDHADEVAWIDVDEVEAGADRDDGRLPPRTTRNRLVASLLALALFVAGVGASGNAAYDRHVTDRRTADLLDLRSGPGAPSIPGLAQLGFVSEWRARVPESVSFAVVNRSPKPVTLLSATITEQGLLSTSSLTPTGDPVLAPGQTGTLTGTITADCTQLTTVQTIALSPRGETQGEFVAPELSVLARTSGGMTGVSQLDPEAPSQADLQQRICLQQGYTLLTDGKIALAANPSTHTITLRLSARAAVAEAMTYSASTAYSDDPTAGVPGLSVSPVPLPESPVDGIVKPGGEVSVEYVINVSSCPVGVRLRADEVQIEFDLSIDAVSLPGLLQSAGLAPLIRQVCGNGA